MHRHNLFFPEELMSKIKALAAKEGISAAEFIRRALVAYLTDKPSTT